ncbi:MULTISPECIES: TAXI family TRAP transporter solute-binding subunit [Catenuloplanes]|uniref:TRAP transporter TAXI family solute receptor n=1 Tax=Catenuloplanes niger TaxID=587534 RepID=A0AAE3ZTV6_9ACTN|nr:TAXI family TRAP transporter solute-binding subunit [Catenuloplanes niger]MDR7325984.1 TRAP transporter TAXI family solute receptor [Catenuloplanes niger]
MTALPRRTLLAGLGGLALFLGTAACSSRAPAARRIRVATGADDIGRELAALIDRQLPGVEVSVVTTTASAAAVALVERGETEIGFAQAGVLSPESSVTALARVYEDLLHLVVQADSPMTTVADLRGRRVSVGAPGSGTAVAADRLLAAARMPRDAYDRRELGLDDATAALSRGELDAFFFAGGLPVAGLRRLSDTLRFRLLDLSGWAGTLGSTVWNVPGSAYRTPPAATIADPTLLVASAAMPDDLAFDVTRLLLEHRDELAASYPAIEALDLRSAIATMPLPLHPGAARYYRSVKP